LKSDRLERGQWVPGGHTRVRGREPGLRIRDVQERGPYALWDQRREFRSLGDGVLVRDCVHYARPSGPLGRATHALAVRAALAAVFDYRFDRIREILARDGDGHGHR